MAQATITARVDANDKIEFDAFCSNVGLNTSTAINIFVKAVLREKRIPLILRRHLIHFLPNRIFLMLRNLFRNSALVKVLLTN